ncbi:MAG: S1 RNA-binding domain-containing protein, partial [Myxococcota bacterium]
MSENENEEDFAAMLAEFESNDPTAGKNELPAVGETVQSKVVSIGRESVFVELGGKAEGILDLEQVTNEAGEVQVAVGDTVEARVVEIRGGQVILRTSMGRGARGPDLHAELVQAAEHGLPVEGLV